MLPKTPILVIGESSFYHSRTYYLKTNGTYSLQEMYQYTGSKVIGIYPLKEDFLEDADALSNIMDYVDETGCFPKGTTLYEKQTGEKT